jgi:hypothetical protein
VGHAHRHRLAYGVGLDTIIVEAATGRIWLTAFGSDTSTASETGLDSLGWEMLLGRPPAPNRLSVPIPPAHRPPWPVIDWLVSSASWLGARWSQIALQISMRVAPHMTARRTMTTVAGILLLAAMGDRSATPVLASLTAEPAPALAPISLALIEPAAVVSATASEVATPPPVNEDDRALNRAYNSVAAAFPDAGSRRELARAQQVWHTDRDRACAHRTGRDRCLHTLTSRRVTELDELRARATGR